MALIRIAAASVVALSLAAACIAAEPTPANPAQEISALKREIAELKKNAFHPELVDLMLGLQIRHARLWSAGEAQNWLLAAFELQQIKEVFETVVARHPEHAALQPQRLADILPAMTKGPVIALRDAIDHSSKAEFERAYDGLSAACTGCHKVAGNDFLEIQRPVVPLLDNLRATPLHSHEKR